MQKNSATLLQSPDGPIPDNSNLEFQFHAVVRKFYVFRQRSIRLLVRQIVTNVREKCALRLQPLHDAQRVLHRRMRRVRLVAQCIQKQNIEVFQLRQRRYRDLTMVGQVSRRAKTKAINLRVAMDQSDRLESRTKQLQRPLQRAHLDLRQSSELVIGIENVSEHVLNESGGVRVRIERQLIWPVQKTQRTQIVNAKKVIGMGMGIQNSIKLANLFANCLLAKIWRGINEHAAPAIFEQHRGPGAPVARVLRMANGVIAPDGGHAH